MLVAVGDTGRHHGGRFVGVVNVPQADIVDDERLVILEIVGHSLHFAMLHDRD